MKRMIALLLAALLLLGVCGLPAFADGENAESEAERTPEGILAARHALQNDPDGAAAR